MTSKLPFLVVGAGLLLGSACSFSNDGTRLVSVKVGASPKTFSGPTIDGMDCLALSISGPGLATTNCVPSISSALVSPAQGVISVRVPTGPRRLVQVMGVSTGSGCPVGRTLSDLLASEPVSSWPSLYVLGQGTIDLFRDATMTIDQSYDPATGGNFIFPGCSSTTSYRSFVYTINKSSSSISVFVYDPTNRALTLTGNFSDANLSSPVGAAADNAGHFLFVANSAGTIATYAIDPGTGDLTFSNVQGPFDPTFSKITGSPIGPFLYTISSSYTLRSYVYSTTGTPTSTNSEVLPISRLAKKTGPPALTWLAVHPAGLAIYITDLTTITLSHVVLSNGIVGAADFQGLSTTGPPAVSPTGRFLYVATGGAVPNINVFPLSTTNGALGTATTATASLNYRAAALDPTGQFFYAGNSSGSIDSYSVNAATGALTLLGSGFASGGSSLSDFHFDFFDTSLFVVDPSGSVGHQLTIDPASGALNSVGSFPANTDPETITVARVPL